MGLKPVERVLDRYHRPFLCHPACPGMPWERTRISYYAAPEMATCAAFLEESRMKFADPPSSTGNPGQPRACPEPAEGDLQFA